MENQQQEKARDRNQGNLVSPNILPTDGAVSETRFFGEEKSQPGLDETNTEDYQADVSQEAEDREGPDTTEEMSMKLSLKRKWTTLPTCSRMHNMSTHTEGHNISIQNKCLRLIHSDDESTKSNYSTYSSRSEIRFRLRRKADEQWMNLSKVKATEAFDLNHSSESQSQPSNSPPIIRRFRAKKK